MPKRLRLTPRCLAPYRARQSAIAELPIASNVPPGHEHPERLFAALSEGSVIRMSLQETFWTPRFGMLTDTSGTPWMIDCEVAPPVA